MKLGISIEKLSKLSRIDVSESERIRLEVEIERMHEWCSELQSVSTLQADGQETEPMIHPLDLRGFLREDRNIKPSTEFEANWKNSSSDLFGDSFRVPSIL